MKKSVSYITEEKKRELEAELLYLQTSKRKEILEALSYAKSLGDLKENAEYNQVREDQGKLEERITKIERVLQSSQVISGKSGRSDGGTPGVVGIGSTVVVVKDGETGEKSFEIVGSEEADMSKGKISNASPFGQALFGRKKDDWVSFKTPNGEARYKIIDTV